MKSSSNTSVSGDLISKKRNGKGSVSSAEPINRTDQPRDSSAKAVSVVSMSKKSNGKAVLCSDVPMRHTGGNSVSSAKTHEVMFFKDVRFGPQEGELSYAWSISLLIDVAFLTPGYCDPRVHPPRKD
ncbi:hypothetical protein YC2023_016591 [Brassica napus]